MVQSISFDTLSIDDFLHSIQPNLDVSCLYIHRPTIRVVASSSLSRTMSGSWRLRWEHRERTDVSCMCQHGKPTERTSRHLLWLQITNQHYRRRTHTTNSNKLTQHFWASASNRSETCFDLSRQSLADCWSRNDKPGGKLGSERCEFCESEFDVDWDAAKRFSTGSEENDDVRSYNTACVWLGTS